MSKSLFAFNVAEPVQAKEEKTEIVWTGNSEAVADYCTYYTFANCYNCRDTGLDCRMDYVVAFHTYCCDWSLD